jgi:hypothetical protein
MRSRTCLGDELTEKMKKSMLVLAALTTMGTGIYQEGEPDENGKIWHRDAEGHLKWQPANKVRQEAKAQDADQGP